MRGDKKGRVLSILRDFPDMDSRKVARLVGCSRVYVYKLRNGKPFVKRETVSVRIPVGLKKLLEGYCKENKTNVSKFLRGYLERKLYSRKFLASLLEAVFEEEPQLKRSFYKVWLESKGSGIKEKSRKNLEKQIEKRSVLRNEI